MNYCKIWVYILILLICTCFSGLADMYKWVDDNGVVHYSDTPPPVNVPKKTEVETLPTFQNTYVEDPAPNEENNSKKKNPAAGKITKNKKKETPSKPRYASRNEVELFTTSWCRYCKDAKKFFESRGIAYAEYDVEKDQAAARRFKKLNKRGGVPFALINGQSISGFRKSVYEAALIK